MPKFKIRHVTKYLYDDWVRDSANQIMLYPIADHRQEIIHHHITISDHPAVNIHTDYNGNKVGSFTHAHPHKELIIDSVIEALTRDMEMPIETHSMSEIRAELSQFRSNMVFFDYLRPEYAEVMPEINKLILEGELLECTPLESARRVCEFIYKNFEYKKGITTIETTVDEIWRLRSGVCQDFAHVMLVIMRTIGIPSRYVSGYICPNPEGIRGEGATHAWVEVFIPFYGWLGFDPTNNVVVNSRHIRLAVGRNFSDCSPVKGTYRGSSSHTLEVTVSIAQEDATWVIPVFSTPPSQETEPAMVTKQTNSFRVHREEVIQQQQQQQQ